MRDKTKSYVQKTGWIWIMLLGMGVVFLGIAIGIQLMPIEPANMNYTVNGVRQPATEGTVRSFKLIFLLSFGLIGLVLAVIGGVIAGRGARSRKLARRLREEGVRLTAQLLDTEASNVYVNGRAMGRVRCGYTDPYGTHYIFRSELLRSDPSPYFVDGQVIVYHDRDDMGKYYVDVDESAGVGMRVVEL